MTDKNEPSEIDCIYNDEIVCPYCGKEFRDSVEYLPYTFNVQAEIKDIECGSCDKIFDITYKWSVTYDSYKKDSKND